MITKVDGIGSEHAQRVSSAVRSASSKKTFPIEVMRDHKEMSVNVTIEDGRSERAIPPVDGWYGTASGRASGRAVQNQAV